MNWAVPEEADNFASMVKKYRQGELDDDFFRRYRLQHGAYGTRMTSDYAMIRVKIPSGVITPEQIECLADVAEQFSIGSAHISTRESVQLHWVVLEDVSEVLRSLAKVGLTSREACGNAIRNVMCSPLSGVCRDECFDATPYAVETAAFFLRNPLNQNLPRKFKINFTCCEKHGMARIVDIGLIPQIQDGRRGFKIFLGGGLGNKSFIAHQLEDFTPKENMLYTAIATVRIFDRLGDRKNLARNRMRYMVNQMGWEKFKELVLKERSVVRATQSVIVKLNPDLREKPIKHGITVLSDDESQPGYERWLETNTYRQRQTNRYSVFVSLYAGDIDASRMRSLSRIIRKYSGEGCARIGFEQNIIIRYVDENNLKKLYAELLGVSLERSGALSIASTVGCTGTTSCNLALTNSHRLAKELRVELLDLKMDMDKSLADSRIRISGCPNSCGQHPVGTIGFYGGGGRMGKDMYPSYMMSIGGCFDGNAMLGVNLMRVPAKRVINVVKKLVKIFKERQQENDTLSSWLRRIALNADETTIADLRKMLNPLVAAPLKEEDEFFYVDYGSDATYHTKTGRGECAV